MILSILVGTGLMFGISVAFSHTPDDNVCLEDRFWEHQQTHCLYAIYEQNNQIIEKIDWQNCVHKYKQTHGYSGVTDDIWKKEYAYNWETLVMYCGDMP